MLEFSFQIGLIFFKPDFLIYLVKKQFQLGK